MIGISLGLLASSYASFDQNIVVGTRYSDQEGDHLEIEVDQSGTQRRSSPFALARLILLSTFAAIALSPNALSSSSITLRRHPSPTSPNFIYPPVKIACVVPPSAIGSIKPKPRDSDVDDWIQESAVVASRGAKILSWSEGAVRLQKDKDSSHEGKEGWEGTGSNERTLLERLAKVTDQYRVYILATYTLPSASLKVRSFSLYFRLVLLLI
jgi:hypothetical protein